MKSCVFSPAAGQSILHNGKPLEFESWQKNRQRARMLRERGTRNSWLVLGAYSRMSGQSRPRRREETMAVGQTCLANHMSLISTFTRAVSRRRGLDRDGMQAIARFLACALSPCIPEVVNLTAVRTRAWFAPSPSIYLHMKKSNSIQMLLHGSALSRAPLFRPRGESPAAQRLATSRHRVLLIVTPPPSADLHAAVSSRVRYI